jgi:tetratricopeptide (TPR) repeat protein
MQYEWDWSGVETALKKAIESNPSYAPAYQWYSYYLSIMGRTNESIEVSMRALEVDPLSLRAISNLATAFYYARNYERAIDECRRAIDMDKNFGVAYVVLGLAYEQKGMYKEAIEIFQRMVVLFDRAPFSIAALAHAYAISGQRAEAIRLISELKDQSKRRNVSPFHIAAIYNGLGEKDLAFQWFGKAYEMRSNLLINLKVEPEFENLRSDPRYKHLLEGMGLAQ